ncbi:hypothetical protein D3C86_2079180 [compost metagenome]
MRVEGFSKIIASILPASGFSAVPALVAAFRTRASSMIVRRSAAVMAERSRKCLVPAIVLGSSKNRTYVRHAAA